MNGMTLVQLEQIFEIAKTGSISKAAINLYTSQPNLSLSLKKLKHELGAQIFERTSTGVRLTDLGRDFVARVQDILLQIDGLEQLCRQDVRQTPLRLRVISPSYPAIDAAVMEMLARHCGEPAQITMRNDTNANLLDELAEGRSDLGFCTVYAFAERHLAQQLSAKEMEYHRLVTLQTGIFVGCSNKRFSDKDVYVDPDKLSGMNLITISGQEYGARRVLDHLWRDNGIEINCPGRIDVCNFEKIRSLANMRDAFVIASYDTMNHGNTSCYDDLRFIPFQANVLSADLGWVQRCNTCQNILAEELLELIEDNFSEHHLKLLC